jgi:hypothetical protein
MMNRHAAVVFLAVAAFASPAAAEVILDQWGTYASAYSMQWALGDSWTSRGGDWDGDRLVPQAEAHVALNSSADALAACGMSPLLKAKAFVGNTEWMGQSWAFAMEGYTYTGSVARTFVVDVDVEGTVVASDTYPGAECFVAGRISVWHDEDFHYTHNDGDLAFDPITYEFAQAMAAANLRLDAGETIDAQQLVFEVQPGESFYVWTKLEARAKHANAAADAWGTMTLSFDDTSQLTYASIPEPATLALLATGAAWLLRRRRA